MLLAEPPILEERQGDGLQRGRASLLEDQEPREMRGGGPPPPPRPPGHSDDGWPRFRGGDGDGLPRWQRLAILGVTLVVAAILGFMVGRSARVFARGLEASRDG